MATKKKKVAVFIDGSNLYFKLKTLIPKKMDFIHYRYSDLIRSLLRDNEELVYTGYYIGVVKDTKKTKNHEKAKELVKNQQRLFDQLSRQKIEVVRGFLLERDGKFFEKGVDVRLAIDIVSKAFEKEYDTALVVSSDTDLIPSITKAIRYGKDVCYVGFEHQPSFGLMRYSSSPRMVTRPEAEKYIAKPLKIRRFDDIIEGKKK